MRLLATLALTYALASPVNAQSLEALCYRTDDGSLFLTHVLHDYYQRYEGFIITPPPNQEVVYFTWYYESTEPVRVAIETPGGLYRTYPIGLFNTCRLNP